MEPVRPIAKYTSKRANPEQLAWWDAHTGERIFVQSSEHFSGDAGRVVLKTFGDVFDDFITHPEVKAADCTGAPATEHSTGELHRLWIDASSRRYISKEARNLELNQTLGAAGAAYREHDLGWDILKARLGVFPRLQISRLSGMSRSQVYEIIDGAAIPQEATYSLLLQVSDMLERQAPADD
jgi:hypothetical protein